MMSDIRRVNSLDELKVRPFCSPFRALTSSGLGSQNEANVMLMSTADGRKYACELPEDAVPAAPKNQYDEAVVEEKDEKKSSTEQLSKLLEPLRKKGCILQDAGWWTFEFCLDK